MNRIRSFLSVAVLISALPAFAANYFVEKPKATGVAAEDAATVEELVKAGVTQQRGQALADSASQADFTLRPRVMRLGKAFLVVLDKVDHSGKVRYTSQVKAGTIEELDTVSTRLVRSVINEVPVQDDTHVGEVTPSEVRAGSERTEATKYWLLGFGPFGLMGLGAQGVSYGVMIGYDWEVENVAAVKVFWAGEFNPDVASMNIVGLGGSYFFSPDKTAALVFGEFGYGGAHKQTGSDVGGFALGVGPGVRFFRTSKINVELQARFGIVLRQIDGSTPSTIGVHAVLMF